MYSALALRQAAGAQPAACDSRHSLRRHLGRQRRQIAFQTLCAALTEICWPTMDARQRVERRRPAARDRMRGCARMIFAITGSRRASARFARSPVAGPRHDACIERQVEEQVLRLHAHRRRFRPPRARGRRSRPAMSRRISRGSAKSRRNSARMRRMRPASTSLAAPTGRSGSRSPRRPGRCARPSAVPRCCGGIDAHLDVQKMEDPGSMHAAERVQRRPAVGEADHDVVARFALPVERRVLGGRARPGSLFAVAPCASTISRPRLP